MALAGAWLAKRVSALPTSGIRDVMARAAEMKSQGRDVIHWYIGRPDFDTPAHIKRACTAALDQGHVHYGPAQGLPALRSAIAQRHGLERGLPNTRPSQVIVTCGASEAIVSTILSCLNPGDEIIFPEPSWPNVKVAATIAGAVPVIVPTSISDNFHLKASAVRAALTPRTKMIVITSPGNPTGAVLPRETLEELAEVVKEHNLIVLADETYNRLYYGKGGTSCAPSMASLPGMAERTVVVSTLSKTYAMDGWRVGWAVAADGEDGTSPLAQAIGRMRYYLSTSSPTFTQHAAVEALEADQACVEDMRDEYDARRQIILNGLKEIPGVEVAEPEGGFMVFPRIDGVAPGIDPVVIARRLLDEHAIAAVSGDNFGEAGRGHLRIAYSCSRDECARGVERLRTALAAMRS